MNNKIGQPFYLKEIERLYQEHSQVGSSSGISPESALLNRLLQTVQDIEKRQSRYAMQADEMTDIAEKAMDNQDLLDNLNHRIHSLNRELSVFREAFFTFLDAYYLLADNLLADSAVFASYGQAIGQQQSYIEAALLSTGIVITGHIGEAFNKDIHQIKEVVFDTGHAEGTIVSVMAKGLVFGGSVLRKAEVTVSGIRKTEGEPL